MEGDTASHSRPTATATRTAAPVTRVTRFLQKPPRETEHGDKSLENGAARCRLASQRGPNDGAPVPDDDCVGRVGERVNGVALLRRLRARGFMFRIEGDAVQVRGGNPGADKAAALAFLREHKAAVL